MKRVIALAALLGIGGGLPSVWSEPLAVGSRVRITGAESFTVPGLATTRDGRLEGRFETSDAETASGRTADGRRLTVPRPEMSIFGALQSADEDTLTIVRADGKGPIVIPRAAVGRLHVHRAGTRRAVGKGIVLGFLGGLVAGTVYGFVGHPPFDHAYEASVPAEALAYGVLFSVPGMVAGGVMGAGREPGWREVPVDRHIRIGLGAARGAPGMRVSVRW